MEEYLKETYFLDFTNEKVIDFLKPITNQGPLSTLEIAEQVYYKVRDEIKYDPYRIVLEPQSIRSSSVISRRYGYCVEKALVLATCMRFFRIPARLGFANVKNHLSSKRLNELMKTDIFVYHGYTEIYLKTKWIKFTPAFNKSLCEKTGVKPLDFDSEHDSIFHPYDRNGKKHMEYLHDYGIFSDLPFNEMLNEYEKYYPHLSVHETKTFGPFAKKNNFEDEVIKI